MLILRNKGRHEFVLTILPRSLFNTLMDLSYSAFVSKLLISNDSLILRSCMSDNFAIVFGCSMTIFGIFSCAGRFPFSCHTIFFMFNWLREHAFFCFSNLFPLHNLLLLLHSIFFSFAADVNCLSKFVSYFGSYNWYQW